MDYVLLPCPFCGGEPKNFVQGDSWGGGDLKLSAYVQCTNCKVYKRVRFTCKESLSGFETFTDAFYKVIQDWNQRPGN